MRGGIRLSLAFILALFLVQATFADFAYVGKIYVKDSATWDNLSSPSDVALSSDAIYVLDSDHHRVVKFQNSDVKAIIANAVGSPGGMLFPRALTLGDDGRMYIANSGANNVLVYEGTNFINSIGTAGTDAYTFQRPSGIAVYDGKIYVSDTERGIISYFLQRDRTYVGTIGSRGFGEGQLGEVWGIAVSNGIVYAADKGNDRVSMFYTNGTYIGRIRGAYECSLSGPRGVAVDSSGNIFISDTGNRRVVVFDKDWNCVETLAGSETAPFILPIGIKLNSTGSLFVSDAGRGNLQVFNYSPYYRTRGGAEARISYAEGVRSSISQIMLAASHLGIGFSDTSKAPLDTAKAEFAKGDYWNAYDNASLSATESGRMNSTIASLVHAQVLKIALGDEDLLGQIDDRASRYNLTVDTGPLMARIKVVRQLLNRGDYAGAAFNITSIDLETRALNSSVSGSSDVNANTRDDLWLAIADVKNDLASLKNEASQYGFDVNASGTESLLDLAHNDCGRYDFSSCRLKLSEARGRIIDARGALGGYVAEVESSRATVASVRQEIDKTYSLAYFFKPDLGKAEDLVAEAERMAVTDPAGASAKAKEALTFIEGARSGISRTNLLTLLGIGAVIVVILVLIGVYYATRGRPRKRKGI